MILEAITDKRVISTNLGMTIVTMIFIGLLAILYFSKKNMDNLENKIYKVLIIGIIIELISNFLTRYTQYDGTVNLMFLQIATRIRLMALISFYFFMIIYRIVIIKNKNNELEKKFVKNKKSIYLILIVIALVFLAISFILPIKLELEEVENIVTLGNSPFFYAYAIMLVLEMLIYVVIMIYSLGKIERKKLFPFIVIDIFLVGIYFDTSLKEYVLSVLGRALAVFIMYHTLENPDVKLVNELELAKNAAEKSNNAKSDFLSSMSHELRTPLNAIVGLSQMIQAESDNLEVQNDAKDIVIASENLLELVNGILDINKLESNELEKIEVNYKPKEIIQDLVKMINIRIGEKNIELKTKISSELPYELFGDKDNIKRIISNLLTNAVKYTDDGYIELNIECTNIRGKCNLRITVTDTGRGISEDRIPDLFTKFNRLESDKDSDIQGTGLGLAITKSLVDLLEGKISVNSTEGVGTTFTVTLTQNIIKQNEFEDTQITENEIKEQKIKQKDDSDSNLEIKVNSIDKNEEMDTEIL